MVARSGVVGQSRRSGAEVRRCPVGGAAGGRCLGDHLTLDDLAQIVDVSPFHFARAFKLSTGETPHAYLRRLRCERAKTLLAGTVCSIGEIAAEVGYETPQAFARMFRAEVGASPGEYRRERRS